MTSETKNSPENYATNTKAGDRMHRQSKTPTPQTHQEFMAHGKNSSFNLHQIDVAC